MSVAFGSNLTVVSHTWTSFKAVCSSKNMNLQFLDENGAYTIYGYDGPEVHTCTIWKNIVPDGVLMSGLTQEQNDTDKTEFEVVYKPHANKSVDLKTTDGRSRIAFEKSDGSKKTVVSHDFTDPTTWAEGSVYVSDEVATDSGDHLKYTLAHANVIDTYHGKISQEDFLKDSQARTYRVSVKINDVAKVERDPHYGTGGDFTVNYNTGEITVASVLDPADIVKVTYHYAATSIYTVKPESGKMLRIVLAEVQFSGDIEITDTITFQPYGFVQYFAPQLCTTFGGPYPPDTKIPLGNPMVYKAMSDYQNEASKAYPPYPALGGNGWRGSTQGIVVFNWDYAASTVISSSTGMEVRITLAHDTPFNGYFATATFYCISENE